MPILLYITIPDFARAKELAFMLVNRHLAAGVNIFPSVTSIYYWQGELRERHECVLVAQSMSERFADIKKFVKAMHPDLCPCILSLAIDEGNRDFLDWIKSECQMGAQCE